MSFTARLRPQLWITVLSALATWISATAAIGAEASQRTERRPTATQSAPHYAGNCDHNARDARREPPRYGDDRDFECFIFDEY